MSTTLTNTVSSDLTVDLVRERMAADDSWVIRGLIAIYRMQTASEQASKSTDVLNGVGFTGVDAAFGSSLAEQAIKRGSLSPKQMIYARRMMRKYAGQLVRIAQGQMAAAA